MTVTQDWLKSGQQTGRKTLAVLIDPDDSRDDRAEVLEAALMQGIELFLVGGSLLTSGHTRDCVQDLKAGGAPRVVLFPGHEIQVVPEADALLFMSLISGRNPEYLIAKQVAAAPFIVQAGLETIPTGYMLIDGGKITSAHYISHTMPIPADKPDIAAATALAGELLGMRLMYLDAGSGAARAVSADMIGAVRKSVDAIIMTGGGIRDAKTAESAWNAGADVVVIGNGAFEDPGLIRDLAEMLTKLNNSSVRV